MRVYLDDERTPPVGWVLVRWPDEAIELLRYKSFTIVRDITDKELKDKQLIKIISKELARLYPLNDFLRNAGK